MADASLYLSILIMHPELIRYASNTYFAVIFIIYAMVLGPLFYNLWVYIGSGNANFFYAITLVYSVGQVILVVDTMFAFAQREWERLNPGWRKMRVETIHK